MNVALELDAIRLEREHRGYEDKTVLGKLFRKNPVEKELGGYFRELEQLLNQDQLEDGDHERFSHYVPKDKILESAVTGKPVRALCGKKWTPGRDPEKFPVCPTCKEIYESLMG